MNSPGQERGDQPADFATPFVPVPFAQEGQYLPSARDVVQAVRRVMVS